VLDVSKTDTEIWAFTESMCRASAGFEPIEAWRDRIGRKMASHRPVRRDDLAGGR
jgi:hypothetical protein